LRQDVIDGIAAQLEGGEYPQKHAIHVRPMDGRYQILSGHHRKAAAKQAGLSTVWCWVEPLDDEAAFMALATSNNQGELDPLEIGIHAYRAVPLDEKRGRGKRGGLSEYARQIGKAKVTVQDYRLAGEVAAKVAGQPATFNLSHFLGRATHLAEIHRLPESCWPAACKWLAESQASVADVKQRVDSAKSFSPIASCDWLFPVDKAVALAFETGRDLSSTFNRIACVVLDTKGRLPPELAAKWIEELQAGIGGSSWDLHSVEAMSQRYMNEAAELADDEPPKPHVANNSGVEEWYTPPNYLEAAREVLGEIDLDPASSEIAQRNVQAAAFYSIDDDGLSQEWRGRVWLNPPYTAGLIDRFCSKLVSHVMAGDVTAAITLTNNATETGWGQQLLDAASAVCFPRGRIRYLDATNQPANAPLQGQMFCYFGSDTAAFAEWFSQFGCVLMQQEVAANE
jgi:ParB family chromosome partitioning protein